MTKKIRYIAFMFFACFCFPVSGQIVKEKFDKMTLSENFDSSTSMWTMVANLDNLFIVQDGEYILNRKTQVSPFAVVAGYNNDASVFRLVSSLKLEKTATDEGSAGLLFMAQDDGKGGFIFEINKFRQYRVKQITGGSYKYVSGEPKNNGWVKSNALSELNLYNLVDIRTADRNYDLYVNNTFLMSFTEQEYKTGKLGIIIGPGSKARVDFFYVFASSRASLADVDATADANKTPGEVAHQGPDIMLLAESIIQLKTQINKANEDNEVLRHTIDAYKMDSKDAEANLQTYEKNIKVLQDELKKQSLKMDSLVKVNAELMKYKELVAGNENSDLIITLSKTVKSEKAENEELRRINSELMDSLAVMKNESTRQANQKNSNKAPASTNQATKSSQDTTTRKGFVLPKDGN